MQALDNGRAVLLQQRLSAFGLRQHGRVSSTQGPKTSAWSTCSHCLLAVAVDRRTVVRLFSPGLSDSLSSLATGWSKSKPYRN